MKKYLKYSIPLVLALALLSGLHLTRNATAIPAPTETTVIASGFSSFDQIKISICGVPLNCTTCWECNHNNFSSPSSTVYYNTGEQYIDYRGTAHDPGSVSVWYWDGDNWEVIGAIGFEDCTLSASGGFFTGISFDIDDLEWEVPIDE